MGNRNLNIKVKLIALSALGFLGLCITLGIFYYTTSNALHEEREAEAQRLIEAATGGLHFFYSLEKSGAVSREVAQQQASKAIGSLRFGSDGYFWINDMDGVMIMHPISDYIGKNMLDTTDNQGTFLFHDFINRAKSGGGWAFYNWPKPGDPDHWYSKVSYVSPFEPWHWIIGTGLYLDDIDREIRWKTLQTGIVVFSIYAAILLITLFASHHFMNQLGELALRDPLTSMFTRRYLNEVSAIFVANQNRNPDTFLAAIFFDIDYFKQVNDTHGHETGDLVLQKVAKTIADATRHSDIAIRFGGEEFVVISLVNDKTDAVDLARRIRSKCAALTFGHKHENFTITISAGLAIKNDNEAMNELIARADHQLYKAKRNGRDRLETEDVDIPL